MLPSTTSVKSAGCTVTVIAGVTGEKSGSYTELNHLVMVSCATPLSPSVTSAFHGCLFSVSSLFLLKTVPSMVGLLNVIDSPFVVRFVVGMLKITRYSQKYRYFPFAFLARNPTATGFPPSSLLEITTLLLSILLPVKS